MSAAGNDVVGSNDDLDGTVLTNSRKTSKWVKLIRGRPNLVLIYNYLLSKSQRVGKIDDHQSSYV